MYKIIGADGKEYGPITAEQLRQWMKEGRINPQTKVLPEGATEWKSLGEMPELAAAFPSSPPPGLGVTPPAGAKVPNYLVQSILVTLCCCLPLGIVAIVYAAQVNSKFSAGDIVGAQESSSKAKMWCWISFGLGLIANAIVLILQVIAYSAAGTGKF